VLAPVPLWYWAGTGTGPITNSQFVKNSANCIAVHLVKGHCKFLDIEACENLENAFYPYFQYIWGGFSAEKRCTKYAQRRSEAPDGRERSRVGVHWAPVLPIHLCFL
uniref:Uncharacterized protein n=1 Tax=Romanomermis culicivorax TaxID=13658 RepID=A0A915HUW4_ROMCU